MERETPKGKGKRGITNRTSVNSSQKGGGRKEGGTGDYGGWKAKVNQGER